MILWGRSARRLDRIEAETERQRRKVAAAADRAKAALTPGSVIAEVGARLAEAGPMAGSVRGAPAPVLLASFGAAWLIGARLGRSRPAPSAPHQAPGSGEETSALGALAFSAGAMAAGASPLSPQDERSAIEAADRAREGWAYGVRARARSGPRP